MWHCSKAHQRPSLIIESTTSLLPMRRPSRTPRSRYGQLLIDSMPPATATSMSPTRMAWSAIITALRPEPHTLLIVSAATWSGSPPWSAAWRAGFWPRPAETTLPMMHSSTICGSMPARRTASATTRAPSAVAVKLLSAPRNFPVGVRTAETMTDSRISDFRLQTSDFEIGVRPRFDPVDDIGAKKPVQPSQDGWRRAHDLARPLGARGFDDQHAPFELYGRDALDRRTDRGAPGKRHLAVGQRRRFEQLCECPWKAVRERTHVEFGIRNSEFGIGNLEFANSRFRIHNSKFYHAPDPRVRVAASIR